VDVTVTVDWADVGETENFLTQAGVKAKHIETKTHPSKCFIFTESSRLATCKSNIFRPNREWGVLSVKLGFTKSGPGPHQVRAPIP
jgi:hypothetical protein